ncbi:MAG TPA: cytidylate kinase-like family protein [Candidatus Binatia bacterium]|nr:cytidylate kinase-like family protein [Candidatus Binatia bacterium]
MPIITIYQGASGSGQELAEAVAGILGYRCVGRTELLEASRRYRIPEAKLNQILEKGPHWWERLLQNMRPYRIALQGAFCEIAADGKIVYHGHLGHELLPGIRHVLKVLLTAPLEVRIDLIRSRENLSQGEAGRYIDEVDKARSRRLLSMFGADWRDSSRYDLVLNLGHMKLESAKRLIISAYGFFRAAIPRSLAQHQSPCGVDHFTGIPRIDSRGPRGKRSCPRFRKFAVLGLGRASRPRGRKSSRRNQGDNRPWRYPSRTRRSVKTRA